MTSAISTDGVLLIDVPEAARRIGMSVRFTQNLVYSGVLPSVKQGKRRHIAVDDLQQYVKRLKANRDEGDD